MMMQHLRERSIVRDPETGYWKYRALRGRWAVIDRNDIIARRFQSKSGSSALDDFR